MGQNQASVCEVPATTQECQHYWVIASAKGPISEGRCKFCGSRKEFKNYLQDCINPDNGEHWERVNWQGGGGKAAEQAILSEIEQLLGVGPTLEDCGIEGVVVPTSAGGFPKP